MGKVKLLDVLFPKTRQEILAAVILQPDKTWYAAELARRMGVPSSSLQRELIALTNVEILKSRRQGRMALYQANSESPIYRDLRNLLLKTAGMIDMLADALKPVSHKLRAAFVFGSAASGNEQSDSDIDLLLIGRISMVQLSLPLRKARDLMGRDINPMVYSEEEFARKRTSRDHFLTSVLEKPRLFVIGSNGELEKASR